MIRVSVTIADEHLAEIESVAGALRDRGMEVEHVHDALGIITGSMPDDSRQALTAVDGVASVDEEMHYQVPPPDSPLQ
ncbi:MAG TPA: hypothetical protein VFJ14_05255 [Nocardioidaceae bacterium]|nr:hypothetical protein [Nocardioidaceae bacterium]